MKLQMHRKFCSKPPRVFDEIRVPKKVMKLREQQLNKYERMRKVHKTNITTIPERNQEATLYLQELTSALLIQKLSPVHL